MDPKTLHQFLLLAEALHYGRASQAANVSLSTLSRNIRQLERELGAVLFERDNRTVRMTAKGQVFENYARDALVRFNVLRQQMADAEGPLKGELSLYCSVTASHSILFDLLEKFRPDFPEVEIKLQTGDPEDAINRIMAGKEDLGIAARPSSLSRTVAYQHMFTSPLLFIAPVHNADASIPLMTTGEPVEWSDVPMILSISGLARMRVDAWFRERGSSPRVYAQVAGNEAIVSMVSLGLGVGVVPKIVLDNSPLANKVKVLRVEPALEDYQLGLFALHRNLNNPLVRAFWHTSLVATKRRS